MTQSADDVPPITLLAQNFEWAALARDQRQSFYLEIPGRPADPPGQLPVLTVTGQQAGRVLLVLAGVHGDEYEGIEAIQRIYERVAPDTLAGTLLMVPVCNPPAYAALSRTSTLDGLDLARVFPGDATGSPTQQLAYWITDRFIRACDFLVDLHSAGLKYRIPRLVGYVASDGEAGRRSRAGAQAFGAPVLWTHPPPVAPGRSLSAAVALGKPSLYAEATGGGQIREPDVRWQTEGVLNVMRWMGMLPGEPQPPRFEHYLVGNGNLDELIRSGKPGHFRAEVELLEPVEAHQRVGAIYDQLGRLEEVIQAEQAGVVVLLRQVPRVEAGDGLVATTSIGKAVPAGGAF